MQGMQVTRDKRIFAMPFSEAQKLSLQIQAFNAFNTPQFCAPNANQSSGSFGTITSTTLDNREVQLVAKYFSENGLEKTPGTLNRVTEGLYLLWVSSPAGSPIAQSGFSRAIAFEPAQRRRG
jgi:hypothetical protein